MSRRTVLTLEVSDQITAAIRAGNYFETACQLAGVKPSLAYEWIARGEGRHPDRLSSPETEAFADAVRRANAFAEQNALEIVLAASRTDWRAAAFILERRFADRFGKRTLQVDAAREAGRQMVDLLYALVNDPDVDLSDAQREAALRSAEAHFRDAAPAA